MQGEWAWAPRLGAAACLFRAQRKGLPEAGGPDGCLGGLVAHRPPVMKERELGGQPWPSGWGGVGLELLNHGGAYAPSPALG